MEKGFENVSEASDREASAAHDGLSDAYFDEMQQVSNYRLLHKTLRPTAIGSIVFGLLAIVMGVGTLGLNPLNAGLALLGLFLLVGGIWIVIAPSPGGAIFQGIALLLVGLWNIGTTAFEISQGQPTYLFLILGFLQVAWGCQSFGLYSRFSKSTIATPSDEALAAIDGIADAISQADVRNMPDVIEFQIETFIGRQPWKGRLWPDYAVFTLKGGQDVVFIKKNRFHIEKIRKLTIGKTLKAHFTLGQRRSTGLITPENFEKFQAWKPCDA